MTQIFVEDLVQSITLALQRISYHHPEDFVQALKEAYARETQPYARNVFLQLLINSRMSVLGHRPICQDTGVANIILKIGLDVRLASRHGALRHDLSTLINDGVAQAYTDAGNPLRATMVSNPLERRENTGDNTPGVLTVTLVPGNRIEALVSAKGGGGDVKARYKVLTPRDDVADWIVNEIPKMGAGWCPPGVMGVGIGGGGPDETMRLAKTSLYTPIDMSDLLERGPKNAEERLRIALFERINALGIGAQGLGGDTTVFDVKVNTAPCHAAIQPIALIPNCAATRFTHFTLDGSGPAHFPEPDLRAWEGIPDRLPLEGGRRVHVDTLTHAQTKEWKKGELLLLSGKILTARDAAHFRLHNLLAQGKPLPVDLRGRILFYVGPVRPVGNEVIGPAGPTTSTRMDKFLEDTLRLGTLATIGKAERTRPALDLIRQYRAPYLIAVGGAAYLVSKSVIGSRVVAFEDLGMEAIYEFEVKDMPVTVAVDAEGSTIHQYTPVADGY